MQVLQPKKLCKDPAQFWPGLIQRREAVAEAGPRRKSEHGALEAALGCEISTGMPFADVHGVFREKMGLSNDM